MYGLSGNVYRVAAVKGIINNQKLIIAKFEIDRTILTCLN